MADDVKLVAKARKIIASCWFDVARIKIRVTRGVFYVAGNISRMGEDPEDPEGNLPFLDKMDDLIHGLPGFRGAHYTFDNWRTNKAGRWQFTGKRIRGVKKK